MIRHRNDLSPTEAQPWSSLEPTDLFYAGLADWGSVCSRRRCELRLVLQGFPRRPPVRPSVDGCARYAAAVPRRLAQTPKSNRGCASI